MGRIVLKIFSILLALLGTFLFIMENEGMGIAAVVVAVIIFPTERRGVSQQVYRHHEHHDNEEYNNRQDIDSKDSSNISDQDNGGED
ncbi:hypothetical protein [Bacillus tuaregi]|uniref:hypothetical protein n=1 Tax=Bacillus tuaregi TaxID=1816695 RepID=UPI0008F95DE2|nr:hypothetical protein [Bacillus tuaregi]